jgi:hypothetical protein
MAITLSYGYVKPSTGDSGTSLFTDLENNIQRVNDHTHNGINSAPLPAQSIIGVSQTISNASWVAHGPTGHYRQLVTLPAGFDFDKVQISFRTSGGAYIHPTVERVSATQYYVYTTNNTINFIAVYGG